MQISINSNRVSISGNIKSVSDYQILKSEIDALVQTQKSIVLDIKESISITSSVIGYFNKLILKDKIDITMNIGNSQLMELIDELNLTSLFKARKA